MKRLIFLSILLIFALASTAQPLLIPKGIKALTYTITPTEVSYLHGITGKPITQVEADLRYPQISEGDPTPIYTAAEVDAMFPTPYATKIVEQKARVSSQNLTYTGTVRMVGVGQTYTTLTDAYTAAANGDILQLIDGTYNIADESGGYWLVNTNTKGVIVKGNVANNAAVIISQTTATAYGIRLRDCTNMTFENITFTSDQNASLIQSEAYASNNYNKFKNCIFTCSSTSSSARAYNRTSAIAGTNVVHLEFDNCVFNQASTSPAVTYESAGVNEEILYKSCTINATGGGVGIVYSSLNQGKIAVYDTQINTNSPTYALRVGDDGFPASYSNFKVDIRNTHIESSVSTHGMLIGIGTDFVYCVNNTINQPVIDSADNLGLVIKTISTAVGNSYFAGNTVNACRPFYVKGGKNCILKYNTFVCTITTSQGLSVINAVATALSTGNVVTQNNIIGGNKAIYAYPSSGFDSAATSMLTWTMDYNRYYTSTANWMVDNATNYTFANKHTFWTNYNDTYSTLITSTTIIFDNKPIVDNTTVN